MAHVELHIVVFVREDHDITFGLHQSTMPADYLLHIHLQTELRLPLLLSTGGLRLNYIWAEAAI